MRLGSQTNSTLAEIAKRISAFASFALCGHIGPDGDSLGSMLALAGGLRQQGKQVTCLLARDDALVDDFSYLEGSDALIPASKFDEAVDCFIAVDVPTRERLADAAEILDRASFSIVIDHHESSIRLGDLNYTVIDAASTSMLIWELLKELGASPTPAIATCAYTGLMTDTGRFQYQNADSAAFLAAAEMVAAGARPDEVSRCIYQNRSLASVCLEACATNRMKLLQRGSIALSWLTLSDFNECFAVKSDSEPIIDTLRSLKGVRVACVLREQDGEVRGSLRAKDDTDVAAVARELGGGGHRAAAGFTLHHDIDSSVALVERRLLLLAEELGWQ